MHLSFRARIWIMWHSFPRSRYSSTESSVSLISLELIHKVFCLFGFLCWIGTENSKGFFKDFNFKLWRYFDVNCETCNQTKLYENLFKNSFGFKLLALHSWIRINILIPFLKLAAMNEVGRALATTAHSPWPQNHCRMTYWAFHSQ